METVFLACFVFGVLFTLASLALGAIGGAHFGHMHVGGHAAHVGAHAHAGAPHGHAAHAGDATDLPLLNPSSVVGALTWFGAAGFILGRVFEWSPVGIIIGALAAGAVGWYLVARFLGLVLKGEVEMDPEDYRLEGTVGQLTIGIPAKGTGEVVFTKADTRRSEAARSATGAAIPRGTEVVITAYADGFALVQPWGEFLAARDGLTGGPTREVVPVQKREA